VRLVEKVKKISPKLYGNKAEQVVALKALDSIAKIQGSCIKKSNALIAGFEIGNYYYFQGIQDSALVYFRKALTIAEKNNDTLNIAALNSNLGAAYLSIGLDRSAIVHFIEARTAMEKKPVRDENYWITLINQAVAHMNQEDYEYADRLLSKVNDTVSPTIFFLKALNLAKLGGLRDDNAVFQNQINRASVHLNQLVNYQPIYHEVKLQFAIKFKDFDILKKYRHNFVEMYDHANSLYLKILLQTASFLTESQFIGGMVEFENLKIKVKEENIVSTELELANLEIIINKELNSSTNYINAIEEKERILTKLNSEASNKELRDFYELSSMRELKIENDRLKTDTRILALKSKNRLIFIVSATFLGLFVVVILWLVNLNLRKRKDLEIERRKYSELSLAEAKLQQAILEKLLIAEEKRLISILKRNKKIEVLKKQINEFLVLAAPRFIGPEKELYKSAKLNIDAFFFNYQEMAMIGSQKSSNSFSFETVEAKLSHQLTYKEVQVANLILNDYTSKEIAILLSKSEKTIEYSRKKIREKLNLDSEIELKTGLILILTVNN